MDFDIRPVRAGPMVVEIGIEVRQVELLQALGVGGGNIAVAQVLADHGAILGLYQTIVQEVSIAKNERGESAPPLSSLVLSHPWLIRFQFCALGEGTSLL